MNKNIFNTLKTARSLLNKITSKRNSLPNTFAAAQFSFQEASDLIKEKLLSPAPCMIARFGSGELNCVANYVDISKAGNMSGRKKIISFLKNEIDFFDWDEMVKLGMLRNAGFFPDKNEYFEKFSLMMMEDMKQVDILGTRWEKEKIFSAQLINAVTVRLPDLEPYFHRNPWSEALDGKKILVVHPFQESIKKQYANRELLFADKRVLPAFHLITLKAIQTSAFIKSEFETWFHALEFMKEQISKIDFDIAIIGCGAYGFPLAAHMKRIGKKSVHLGGATQILFGIKGKRWEEMEQFNRLINEHWIRPSESEKPKDFKSVENGCYW
jgi:hypothetical protein